MLYRIKGAICGLEQLLVYTGTMAIGLLITVVRWIGPEAPSPIYYRV
jgi:hypothetical protein